MLKGAPSYIHTDVILKITKFQQYKGTCFKTKTFNFFFNSRVLFWLIVFSFSWGVKNP